MCEKFVASWKGSSPANRERSVTQTRPTYELSAFFTIVRFETAFSSGLPATEVICLQNFRPIRN